MQECQLEIDENYNVRYDIAILLAPIIVTD